MKLVSGVDLVEVERVRAVLTRHGQRFLERVFTPDERTLFSGQLSSLAVRFAAKEAVSKALGCGIGEVSFQDIEILRDEKNAPTLSLSGAAAHKAGKAGLSNWSISLSHTAEHAIAFVVASGD